MEELPIFTIQLDSQNIRNLECTGNAANTAIQWDDATSGGCHAKGHCCEGMVLCEWKLHREGKMLHENNAVRGMIGREGMSE